MLHRLTDHVFSVSRFPKLIDEELYGIGGRSDEAYAPQVPHLFSIHIIQSAKESGLAFIPTRETKREMETYSIRNTSFWRRDDWEVAVDMIDT